MAWTAPKTWTNAVLTAAELNTHVRDNLNETAPGLVTTAGDMIYATGANAAARLAIGTGLQILRTNAGATAPEWVDPSTALQTLELLAAGRLTSAANGITLSSYGNFRRLRLFAWIEYANSGGGAIALRLNNVSTGSYYGRHYPAGTYTLINGTTSLELLSTSIVAGSCMTVLDILADGAAVDEPVVTGMSFSFATGGSTELGLLGGGVNSTAQYVTQIDVFASTNDFAAGTHYALYGSDDVA